MSLTFSSFGANIEKQSKTLKNEKGGGGDKKRKIRKNNENIVGEGLCKR